MNQELKQRLVGATVLILLGIIILPMLLGKPTSNMAEPEITNIQLTRHSEKTKERTIPSEVISRYEESELELKQPKPPVDKAKNKAVLETKVNPKLKVQARAPVAVTKLAPVTSSQKVSWAVQMGSFSSKENASRLVKRMKAAKIPAYFEHVDSNGKKVFRVRVGPLKSKQSAERMKLKLDRKERLKTLIVTLQ